IAAPATAGSYKLFVIDAAGNISNESTATLTVDNTAPSITSIVRQTPSTSLTNATSVTFRVTFSENVSNIDLTDFELNTANTATGTLNAINTVTASTVYDIV